MSEQRDELNLETLANAVDGGADRLRFHLDRFEGGEVQNGTGELVIVVGIRQLYEKALDDKAEMIYSHYEALGDKPPPESIRYSRARQYVERTHPKLAADYHSLAASIKVGEKWLMQKRASLSAMQSLNKTGRELAGSR